MKKIISILLVCILMLGFSACKQNNIPNSEKCTEPNPPTSEY